MPVKDWFLEIKCVDFEKTLVWGKCATHRHPTNNNKLHVLCVSNSVNPLVSPNCKTRPPQSPFCAADLDCHPSILMDAEKSLLLLQSYKCLLMVLRGMSKAGCFL